MAEEKDAAARRTLQLRRGAVGYLQPTARRCNGQTTFAGNDGKAVIRVQEVVEVEIVLVAEASGDIYRYVLVEWPQMICA